MKDLNFWKKISHPIVALAPMSGVTDAAFRFMVVKYSNYKGKDIGNYGEEELSSFRSRSLDVVYTEFISSDGLFWGEKEEIKINMKYSEIERPIVVQFFSSDLDRLKRSASMAVEMGFNGVDLNMGCPDRSVCKQGAGSELIKDPKLAGDIIRGLKKELGEVPLSVKTRAGYFSEDEIEDWLSVILEAKPDALILHARTKKDMYKAPARWSLVEKAVHIRDKINKETVILGNGDLFSVHDLYEKVKKSGADGGMVGRAVLGNPWFFDPDVDISDISKEKRLEVLLEHCYLFEKLFSGKKNFSEVKKHFRGYVSGWEGAKELRSKLMSAQNSEDVERIISQT